MKVGLGHERGDEDKAERRLFSQNKVVSLRSIFVFFCLRGGREFPDKG